VVAGLPWTASCNIRHATARTALSIIPAHDERQVSVLTAVMLADHDSRRAMLTGVHLGSQPHVGALPSLR
jgi:hypothetical protein